MPSFTEVASYLRDRPIGLFDDPNSSLTELPVVLLPLLWHLDPYCRCLYGPGGTSIAKIDSTRGRRTYARRAGAIEPVFAQIKHNRKIRTISRRGLSAADSEWKLICATHNLLKLYRLT